MTYTVRFGSKVVGPASIDELERQLGGRTLKGSEPVTCHSRLGDMFGQARAFPDLKSLIAPTKPGKLESDYIGPRPHVPNQISIGKRLWALLAICISVLVLYEYVTTGHTTLSAGKRGPSFVATGLWGLPAVAIFGGTLSAGLSLILDHYDRRPNERIYNVWLTISIASVILGKVAALIVIYHLRAKNA